MAGAESGRPSAVTWAGLAVVAAASAVLSFATVRDLAASAGYPDRLAWLLPVVIDATAVVGSRIWLGGAGHPDAVRYARTLALAAAVVTVGANVLQHGLAAYHAAPPWWLVATLAAIPPTALVAVAHQVALLSRPTPATAALEPAAAAPGDAATVTSAPVARPDRERESSPVPELLERTKALVDASPAPVGRRRLAKELDVTEHQARQLLSRVTRPAGDTPSTHSLRSPAQAPARVPVLNGAHHV